MNDSKRGRAMLRTTKILGLTLALSACAGAPRATDAEHARHTVHVALAKAGLAERASASRATGLPDRADEPLVLRGNGMSVAVSLDGARPSPGRVVDGARVHVGALDGGHLVRVAFEGGAEDLIVLESAERRALRFRARFDGVSGLRLVDGVLEALDESGAPRLRMEAPYAIDAGGVRVRLAVAIDGCAVSLDPAPPWGRPVVAPGATECGVTVSWRDGLAAPLVVDPTWSTTGSMSIGRALHAAAKITGGRVLVAGGTSTSNIDPLASAEIFDPKTGTWAMTSAMTVPRLWHTLTALADGRALVAGGSTTGAGMDGSGVVDSAELYDSSTGAWGAPTQMSAQHRMHTATLLDDGRVVVAGGLDSMLIHVGAVDVLDPKTSAWSQVPGGLAHPRRWHTATKRKDGTVLFVGGDTGQGTFEGVTVNELYDPKTNTLGQGPPLLSGRKHHVAALLQDGSVIVLGGTNPEGQFVLGGEIVDAALSAFSPVPGEIQARVETAAEVVGGGDLLVVGGFGPLPGMTTGTKDFQATTELYRPATKSFVVGPSLATARSTHTMTVLDDGRVLVVGGDVGPLASAEIYAGSSLGGACGANNDCTSGFCVDGVCCDRACDAACEACDGGKKGVCAPIVGTPHGARPVCAGTGKCAGACDGKTAASCTFPDAKAPCATSCDAAKGTAEIAYCDGMGACGSPKPTACGAYACGADACRSSCAGDGECAPGYVCGAGKCVPPGAVCVDDHTTRANGKSVDCAPYKCGGDGTCRQTCASSADCANGFACGSSGLCAKAAPPADAGSSGGCALAPATNESARVGWLALALAIVARRRRARR